MDEEKNTGIFSNLGLARANNVKMMFTALGVVPTQITTDALMQPGMSFAGDSLVGGAAFSFTGMAKPNHATDYKLATIEKKLRATPFILYFGSNQKELNLTEDQRQNFSDLIYYLEHKTGSSVMSEGHTDNVGQLASNMTLSNERAAFVKEYLTKNGINTQQIKTEGKGSTKPITSNDSEAARAKNRRVEISIE